MITAMGGRTLSKVLSTAESQLYYSAWGTQKEHHMMEPNRCKILHTNTRKWLRADGVRCVYKSVHALQCDVSSRSGSLAGRDRRRNLGPTLQLKLRASDHSTIRSMSYQQQPAERRWRFCSCRVDSSDGQPRACAGRAAGDSERNGAGHTRVNPSRTSTTSSAWAAGRRASAW